MRGQAANRSDAPLLANFSATWPLIKSMQILLHLRGTGCGDAPFSLGSTKFTTLVSYNVTNLFAITFAPGFGTLLFASSVCFFMTNLPFDWLKLYP